MKNSAEQLDANSASTSHDKISTVEIGTNSRLLASQWVFRGLALVYFGGVAFVPFFGNDFLIRLATEAVILGLLALSVDLLLG